MRKTRNMKPLSLKDTEQFDVWDKLEIHFRAEELGLNQSVPLPPEKPPKKLPVNKKAYGIGMNCKTVWIPLKAILEAIK